MRPRLGLAKSGAGIVRSGLFYFGVWRWSEKEAGAAGNLGEACSPAISPQSGEFKAPHLRGGWREESSIDLFY